jgi:hypothetical protein
MLVLTEALSQVRATATLAAKHLCENDNDCLLHAGSLGFAADRFVWGRPLKSLVFVPVSTPL